MGGGGVGRARVRCLNPTALLGQGSSLASSSYQTAPTLGSMGIKMGDRVCYRQKYMTADWRECSYRTGRPRMNVTEHSPRHNRPVSLSTGKKPEWPRVQSTYNLHQPGTGGHTTYLNLHSLYFLRRSPVQIQIPPY
ncbi:hypothetical protein J6590_000317 [Homalodisca vitripennis]|nr:hypothetical protein J6590_000317 [Homalodisca vitripennis]